MATEAEEEEKEDKEQPKKERKEEPTGPPMGDSAAANTSTVEMGKIFAQQSVLYGYGAAVALAAQGLFIFEGKMSVQSVGHVLGAIAFTVAANQHCSQSMQLLGGP